MHFDKAFIIGLPDHMDKRLERCFKRCEGEGVNIKLWSGIYGLDVDIPEYQAKGYLSDDFDLQLPGSLGCMLSHITLWESIEKDPDCKVALICEDDILLKSNFLKDLESIPWSDVPDDWDFIKLSYHGLDGEKVSDNIIKPSLSTKRGANSGTFCYLMKASSAQILKSILVPYNGRRSMDVLLRESFSRFHPYLTVKILAREERFRYSIRKDLNLKGQKRVTLKKLLVKIAKFLFP
jgi:GR25 family glycosyltransferase involved in LPS biosynthesis